MEVGQMGCNFFKYRYYPPPLAIRLNRAKLKNVDYIFEELYIYI